MGSYPWSAGEALPRYRPPAGATDTHLHLYHHRYPPDPAATLRPGDATVAEYRLIQARLGLARCVVVQPSTYGTDNQCLLDSLVMLGDGARGVAVVDGGCSNAELARLHAAGVRGLRFNLVQGGDASATDLAMLAHRIAPLGWHVQLQAAADTWLGIGAALRRLPVPVVIDHMGRLPQPAGTTHPAWRVLLDLVDAGQTWVKLSGAYLESRSGPPNYDDAGAVARAWVAHAPDRLVWGTDWPHPSASTGNRSMPDDARLLELLVHWAGSQALLDRILVANPCALYGFDPPSEIV